MLDNNLMSALESMKAPRPFKLSYLCCIQTHTMPACYINPLMFHQCSPDAMHAFMHATSSGSFAHHLCSCRYSTSNTRSGIESCGILAGILREKQGVFVISTLIIPKQEGTSDTVQALNEEEIFDVQDKRALYPLGWIHTHPTQTCFLSSVDVHTQCGYQVMLELGFDDAMSQFMSNMQIKE